MLVFAMSGSVPPGGVFFYSDPANGVPLAQDSSNLDSLIRKVRAAYATAGKPCPEPLGPVVEDFICRHVRRGFCIGPHTGVFPEFLTTQNVKAKTKAAADSTTRVDPGATRDRMIVCGQCKSNSRGLCLGCTGLTKWAVGLAGRTQVAMDDSLGVCRYDHIMLSSLVSLKGLPAPVADGRPENCWRLNDAK